MTVWLVGWLAVESANKFLVYRSQNVELKYRMDHPKRGRFIIFNKTTFNVRGKKLDARSGTAVDSRNLKDVFEKVLHFEVEVHNDLTCGQMEDIMRSGNSFFCWTFSKNTAQTHDKV